MAKYMNKQTGNIVVPKDSRAEELMEKSTRYEFVGGKKTAPVKKGRKPRK